MSLAEVMWAGLRFGTISTSVLVANSTGLATSLLAYSAAGCFGLAAANTSAGAPCSILILSAPDPPNVYFAPGSIRGNTLVSDAAANTVGRGLLEAAVELGCGAVAAARDVVLLEPLLPQPPESAESPMTAVAVNRVAQD